MGTALETFRNSNAWDARYDLPLAPTNNNPWIYSAYADLCIRFADGQGLDRQKLRDHFVACENAVLLQNPKEYDVGCFARWPDGGGGTSHDEIMGAAYFDPWIAQRILGHLERTDGVMNNLGEIPTHPLFDFNVYRMIFLKPFLLACADYDVNFFHQLCWCVSMVYSVFTQDANDQGGRLRNWLMCDKMKRFSFCRAVIKFWLAKVGLSPKECLAIEPGDCPAYRETAPATWDVILMDEELNGKDR